eukprot:TRINITY_DN45873_c0_g1_i1.p1 TRINITY_DN45873_c0_g1~~TRINITY_DN45873_c0_g1_i1.p1  ORF type:complete len:252 (+),score=49.70 TRINITY_DN45873_c0_g1_i1:67-822(+)
MNRVFCLKASELGAIVAAIAVGLALMGATAAAATVGLSANAGAGAAGIARGGRLVRSEDDKVLSSSGRAALGREDVMLEIEGSEDGKIGICTTTGNCNEADHCLSTDGCNGTGDEAECPVRAVVCDDAHTWTKICVIVGDHRECTLKDQETQKCLQSQVNNAHAITKTCPAQFDGVWLYRWKVVKDTSRGYSQLEQFQKVSGISYCMQYRTNANETAGEYKFIFVPCSNDEGALAPNTFFEFPYEPSADAE